MSRDLRILLQDTASQPTRSLDTADVVGRARRQLLTFRAVTAVVAIAALAGLAVGVPALMSRPGGRPLEIVGAPDGEAIPPGWKTLTVADAAFSVPDNWSVRRITDPSDGIPCPDRWRLAKGETRVYLADAFYAATCPPPAPGFDEQEALSDGRVTVYAIDIPPQPKAAPGAPEPPPVPTDAPVFSTSGHIEGREGDGIQRYDYPELGAAFLVVTAPDPTLAQRIVATIRPIGTDTKAFPRGRTFVSTSVTESDEPVELFAGIPVTVTFGDQDEAGISWRADCNGAGASMIFSGGRIVITGDITQTLMGCSAEAEQRDEWLNDFFTASPNWKYTGDRLILVSGDRRIELRVKQVQPSEAARDHPDDVDDDRDRVPAGVETAPPAPQQGPRSEVTRADQVLVRDFVAFATGSSDATFDELPLAGEVRLGMGSELLITRTREQLRDPAAWTMPLDGFRARAGETSAVELVAAHVEGDSGSGSLVGGKGRLSGETVIKIGPYEHCGRREPFPASEAVDDLRAVSVQAEDGSTATWLAWFSVTLYVDQHHTVQAVTFDLCEP